jgi:hypothetical protein
MARTVELTTTLTNFETVVRSMRKLGVASWQGSPVGDIVLGPAPLPNAKFATETDPKAARKAYYSEVFGRPVGEAELRNLP